MKKILVFFGNKGVGKDTCYEIFKTLYPNLKIEKLSFADKLKETIWSLFKTKIKDKERIYGSINKKEEPITDFPIPSSFNLPEQYWSGRRLLQYFGTDICRTMLKTVWVDCMIDALDNCKADIVCITDCRFINEYEILKNYSKNIKFIKVERTLPQNEFSKHESEKDVSSFKADLTINNNGTLEELKQKIINFKIFI